MDVHLGGDFDSRPQSSCEGVLDSICMERRRIGTSALALLPEPAFEHHVHTDALGYINALTSVYGDVKRPEDS